MIFNFNHGQARVEHTAGGMPTRFRWREMTPKKLLMFALPDGSKVRVDVDNDGFADVEDPLAMQHLATLGYPLAPGPVEVCGALPVGVPVVLWNEELEEAVSTGEITLDWSQALCKTGFGHKALVWRGFGPTDAYAAALPNEAVHPEPWRHVPHWTQNPSGEGLVCWCEGGQSG